MSRSYSTDLRVRVIRSISGGLSRRRAAARCGVGVSTAVKWYRRYRETGEVAARKQGQPGGSKLDAHEAFILALVKGAAGHQSGGDRRAPGREAGCVGLSGDGMVFP